MDEVLQRKIRDSCATLYDCRQKWTKSNVKGVSVVNDLINLKLRAKYVESDDLGILSELEGFRYEFSAKLMEKIEESYETLRQILATLIRLLTGQMQALTVLVWNNFKENSAVVAPFETLTANQFSTKFESICEAFISELSVKKCIVENLLATDNYDTLTLYLTTWLHEPYIGESVQINLEALILETKLKNQPLFLLQLLVDPFE
ncbi:cyclin-dependent kinase 2-interacting protein-like isoform X2 [Oscarella lobularis]|uniref:cyclin-dependent kinase 2-interacting protein-like isoform X2 n=1 Tax=Oscarella lobularis TaxID=121494 RepID=UPI00331403B6